MNSRNWCFTLNNPTSNEIQSIDAWDIKALIVGLEHGGKGTEHLQGNVIFKTSKRLTAVKKLSDRAHWEITKSPSDAWNYCSKEKIIMMKDNRSQGKRSDLIEATDCLKQGGIVSLIDKHPDIYVKYSNGFDKLKQLLEKPRSKKPEVIWIFGKTGTGKTKMAYERNPDNCYITMKDKNGLITFNGYRNEQVCIMDEMRQGSIPFDLLLGILDRYPLKLDVKYGYINFNSDIIYITSPFHPKDCFKQNNDNIDQLLRRVDSIVETKVSVVS